MPSFAPALLRPVQRQRYRWILGGTIAVPRPYEAPRAHAPGVNPDRVLVFGNGLAVGWGVRSHDLALPGQLARALTARTGRGTDVHLLADTRWDIESAADDLRGRDLRGYDAVVVVMGASDAFRLLAEKRWIAGVTALLDRLESQTSPTTPITMMGIQQVSSVPVFHSRPGGHADSWAIRLNDVTRTLCEKRSRVHFLLPPVAPEASAQTRPAADDRRYRSPQRFFEWAAVQAEQIAPFLDAYSGDSQPARRARNTPQSTQRRIATLGELQLLDTPAEKRFDDIVRRAQQMFGTSGAVFSVIDRDRQWNKAVRGLDFQEIPIGRSFCAATISRSTPLIVEDAWIDDRVPGVGVDMRFYAGHPIEAIDGTRIGALCVFDEDPRPASTVDVRLLRDLALAIQRELSLPAAYETARPVTAAPAASDQAGTPPAAPDQAGTPPGAVTAR
jgi:hypothetical protein